MWRQTYSKIQDEIFKKLIDVSKKAGMPHRYEFTASSVAWCAPMKTKDSVRCDEVQKLPPERSQRSQRNEPRVGQPWRNPQENCQDSNGWEGGRTVTDCLEEAFFWMHDVIWIFNVFGVYWAILKHHWYLNPDLWNLMKSSSKYFWMAHLPNAHKRQENFSAFACPCEGFLPADSRNPQKHTATSKVGWYSTTHI